MEILTDTLPPKYHDALVAWQKKHFTDYDYLMEHWSEFYRQAPFQLIAKLGPLKNPTIEVGKFAGRQKFQKADEMDEEMILKTTNIVKAQASTELGSIQQHRESVHKAQDPKMQFDVLRVMAEEFRHAYQMVYVLSKDGWSATGKDLAQQTIDELLGMETGSHVLDAFNLYFDSFVDNITFCAIIDRVGKYQLTMQTVFAYAPMACSMGPMLSEEAFHLASGVNPLKTWARQATNDEGHVSIESIQRHINKWLPRGLEMFGDERGGRSNVELGFKNMTNKEALEKYYQEIKESVVDMINYEVVRTRIPAMAQEQALALADEVLKDHSKKQGIAPEDLVYLPSEKFFRRRGMFEFQMNDVRGNTITSFEQYIAYIRTVLPESYVAGRDFAMYIENLKKHQAGQEVKEEGLPFYG